MVKSAWIFDWHIENDIWKKPQSFLFFIDRVDACIMSEFEIQTFVASLYTQPWILR